MFQSNNTYNSNSLSSTSTVSRIVQGVSFMAWIGLLSYIFVGGNILSLSSIQSIKDSDGNSYQISSVADLGNAYCFFFENIESNEDNNENECKPHDDGISSIIHLHTLAAIEVSVGLQYTALKREKLIPLYLLYQSWTGYLG